VPQVSRSLRQGVDANRQNVEAAMVLSDGGSGAHRLFMPAKGRNQSRAFRGVDIFIPVKEDESQ
jgi:hypothetical protein